MSDPSSPRIRKRVTFKKTCENHNIRALLKELYYRILGKDHKTAQKLEQALVSLSKYPVEITSGDGCYILQGFDKNLCKYVDEHLFKKADTSIANHNSPIPSLTENFECVEVPDTLNAATNAANEHKRKKSITNYDAKILFDSALFALHRNELQYPNQPALDIKELLLNLQVYSTQSISDDKFMKILETRRTHIKSKLHDGVLLYSLTYLGRELVEDMMKLTVDTVYSDKNLRRQCEKNDRVPSCGQHQYTSTPLNSSNDDISLYIIDMPPGSYDVIMLVDKNEPEMFTDQGKNGKSESRSLKVGDIIWVARCTTSSQELVLPYVIERKRMDDFAASIKDGRFHEQKFRLRKCRLRNVIYLLEDHQGNKHCGLPMATLNQARATTRVQEGFMIHHTDSVKGTKRFLNGLTSRLTRELEDIHLRGINSETKEREYMAFEYFNASSSKTKPLTVKELFIKMLLQLKGLSVEKALAITKKYNSPMALMNAYKDCGEDFKSAELLLANLKFNASTPRVAPAISKIMYLLFGKFS